MTAKSPETPKESVNETRRELDALNSELLDPWMDYENPFIDKIKAKEASSSEMDIMKKYDISQWWKVNIFNLVDKILTFNNYNLDNESWKELRKSPTYIACVQAALNIFNKPCTISWKYTSQTKESLEELIWERIWDTTYRFKSDWIPPLSMRNVLANALIYPKKAKSTEVTKTDWIRRDTRKLLEKTNWICYEWVLEAPRWLKNDYPAWTQIDTTINY